jgi:ATP-dependent 26S proteasome regulatory subunit
VLPPRFDETQTRPSPAASPWPPVLSQVNPEGKYVVDLDPSVDITKVTPNARVALRNDSYTLHKILPNKV